ncbi:aminotransferase [Aspergillus costaricaensis CBS 115574]|uniref:Aminotransferase n=1 Tax=Aspergillus costaricaensis CBS 115574 TaxID=1448317 RepID=A0ACD1I0I9_9EURO|nr:aminotransferase [Aspergillus costaricaensis CBS 115574]RAK83816.1 aminotransferase [Aspergillus costaricaensis CBS 115574]
MDPLGKRERGFGSYPASVGRTFVTHGFEHFLFKTPTGCCPPYACQCRFLPPSLTAALQSGIAKRRQQGQYFEMSPPATEMGMIDFGSNDTLGLRSSPSMHETFHRELKRSPEFVIGAGASRCLGGSTNDVTKLERLLADFHHGKEAVFFNSGYEANVGIYSTLLQPGDAVIHDTMAHASIRDGIRYGRASIVKAFAHNNPQSLDDVLEKVKLGSADISCGRRTVFIALESFYSMEGDISPIPEILSHVRSALPAGNGVLVVDEAHTTGIVGPNGSGYISLGTGEGTHHFNAELWQGPGALGGVGICDPLIKEYMANFARGLMYSTGPSFPTIAAIGASIATLSSADGEQRRQRLRANIKIFPQLILMHPWRQALSNSGVLKFPSIEKTKNVEVFVAIIPIITEQGQCHKLQQRLQEYSFRTHAVRYPAVPKEEERVRLMLHADNQPDEIRGFVRVLREWGWEMMQVGAKPESRL